MDNLINTQLCNHHPYQLHFLNVIICSFFYWLITKIFFHRSKYCCLFSRIGRKYRFSLSKTLIFSNNKIKSQCTLERLGSIKKSKYRFCACGVILDWYLFQLTIFYNQISIVQAVLDYLQLIKLLLENSVLYQLL